MTQLDPSDPRLRAAREKWKFRGAHRPSFASPTSAGEESVWDYPRPPRLDPEGRRVRIESEGEVLADSVRALRVLETASPPTYYLPRGDIAMERLGPSDMTSICEWKGAARYYSLVGGETPVAWYYPEPFAQFEKLRGYLGFYPGRLRCWLDEEEVRPQPGGLYAGWITEGIRGPFKGEPGTEDW